MTKRTECQSPVALVIFRRPDTTRRVFERIREVRPPKLFVIADGPREASPNEVKACLRTRAIIDEVDWDCEVARNFSDRNLGLRARVASGLDWVFEHVDRAIILEDDCVPHSTFFRFCDDVLERYARDSRVTSVSGTNVQKGRKRGPYSYYFSRYPDSWGWATWRRAWQSFDVTLSEWPVARRDEVLRQLFPDDELKRYWEKNFDRVYNQEIDSWAYGWTLMHFLQNGLCAKANVNLISNVGFRDDATHTTNESHPYAAMPAGSLALPIEHPPYIVRHREADDFYESTKKQPSLLRRAYKRCDRQYQRIRNILDTL